HPLMLGPPDRWSAHLAHCRAMGFDHVLMAPLFAPGPTGDVFLADDLEKAHPVLGVETADQAATQLAAACATHELGVLLDVIIDRVHVNGRLAREHSELYEEEATSRQHLPDPRVAMPRPEPLSPRFDRPDSAERLMALWSERLYRLLAAGVRGFRFHNPQNVPAELWRGIHDELRARAPRYVSLAWTPGLAWSQIEGLARSGFDGVFSSLPWWDGRASWFVQELEILRRVAPVVVACPEAPFAPPLPIP